ncbi:response regulator [Clostridium sp.]|uniref:response regulator n=1 Tax=Clostridium sp. TaxID=1506 RepID=UPI003D6C784D
MTKIMIVDDDVIAKANLRTMIGWENPNFQFCKDCSNGKVAMDVIQATKPDIVITDMNMPIMNGVELISFITKNYPNIKIIALSAYDDYDYVRESLKMGAVDYILKHKMSKSNILDVLNTTVDLIEKGNKAIVVKTKLSEEMVINNELVKRDLLIELSRMKKLRNGYLEKFKKYFNIDIELHNIFFIIIELDDYKEYKKNYSYEDENVFINSYIQILNEVVGGTNKIILSHLEEGKFVLLLSFSGLRSELEISFQLNSITERIKLSTKRFFNKTVSLGVSDKCSNISELRVCYLQAESALKYKFLAGKGNTFKLNDQKKNKSSYYDLDIKDEKNISACIEAFEWEKLKSYIYNIYDNIILHNIDTKIARVIWFQIINIISKVLRKNGVNNDLFIKEKESSFEILENFETAEDQKDYVINICNRVMELLKSLKIQNNYSNYTKNAIKFINENYKKNICLDDVAQNLGISSPYLSRIFRNDCEGGFSSYLNMVRVANVKILIRNGSYNLKEIVNETGFNNYNYFFKVFKEIEGMTPIEYKVNLNKE